MNYRNIAALCALIVVAVWTVLSESEAFEARPGWVTERAGQRRSPNALEADEAIVGFYEDSGAFTPRNALRIMGIMGWGVYELKLHADCNLVLRHMTQSANGGPSTRVLWQTHINQFYLYLDWLGYDYHDVFSKYPPPTECYGQMQQDGNFVIYGVLPGAPSSGWPQRNNERWSAIWATDTEGNPGAWLQLEPNGNLVVYSSGGGVLWATNTAQTPPPPPVVTNEPPDPHPGCRFAETKLTCIGVVEFCQNVYVCDNTHPIPMTVTDGRYVCGACFGFKF
jgi:hypothetical protein